MTKTRYPEPPKTLDPTLKNYFNELIRTLTVKDQAGYVNSSPYKITEAHYVLKRNIDPTAITTAQLADVLSTLLIDLQNAGIIDARTI